MRVSIRRVSFGLFITAIVGLIVGFTTPSNALSGSSWRAGNIIEDSVFFDDSAMTVNEIQDFLNALVPSCDTWGKKAYSSTQTRAQFGTSQGVPPPYICVKNYYENPTTHATNFNSTASIPSGAQSAAQIIYDASRDYNINPKVLLVTIKKEAADNLIEDDWPWLRQYRSALGFGCPDTAACDSQYYGFYNQVRNAAKQFWLYARYPDSYRRKAGGTYAIQYHPYNNCSSPKVTMENQATAGLYNYTPYQPNAAALANLYGTGDSCSSYGNRNFWRIWNDWFGSTHSSIKFVSMDTPRWMQLKQDTTKIEPFIQTPVENSSLITDQQIYFSSKITINGITYLRTKYDTDRGYNKVVPLSLLDEVSVNYISLVQPRWMQTTEDTHNLDPVTNKPIGEIIPAGTWYYLATKTTLGGVQYLRTQQDTRTNLQAGLPSDVLEDVTFEYGSFTLPRWLVSTQTTYIYDLRDTLGNPISTIPKGTKVYLDKKIGLNGIIYGSNGVPNEGVYTGVPINALRDMTSGDIGVLSSQRAFSVTTPTQKIDISTNLPTDTTLSAGEKIYFQGIIDLGGVSYLRSAHDTENGLTTVVRLSDISPIDVSFETMVIPRSLRLKTDLRKADPVTLREVDDALLKGRTIAFSQKITINGIVYLRTSFDTAHSNYKVIPLTALAEL